MNDNIQMGSDTTIYTPKSTNLDSGFRKFLAGHPHRYIYINKFDLSSLLIFLTVVPYFKIWK
jgi:hypothetical protein